MLKIVVSMVISIPNAEMSFHTWIMTPDCWVFSLITVAFCIHNVHTMLKQENYTQSVLYSLQYRIRSWNSLQVYFIHVSKVHAYPVIGRMFCASNASTWLPAAPGTFAVTLWSDGIVRNHRTYVIRTQRMLCSSHIIRNESLSSAYSVFASLGTTCGYPCLTLYWFQIMHSQENKTITTYGLYYLCRHTIAILGTKCLCLGPGSCAESFKILPKCSFFSRSLG